MPDDKLSATSNFTGMPYQLASCIESTDIGVDADYLHRSILKARFLRSRYTVLDLLDDGAADVDGLGRGLCLACQVMHQHRFDHLIDDRAAGVEGGGGALRDVGNLAPTQRAQPGA